MPDWIGLYLEEDLGPGGLVDHGRGDVTSAALLDAAATGTARIVARQAGFVAGAAHAVAVFARLGARAEVVKDGRVTPGDVIVRVDGPSRAILAAERTALNLLGRMSGVATLTDRLVRELRALGAATQVAATRKTTPGFRAFEKEAVAAAGGEPYRMGLYDVAMVKDNHLAAVGDAAAAVCALRQARPHVPIVVEAESLDVAMAAAGAGADWIMIDNQPPGRGKEWAEALRDAFDVRIEASGGISPGNVHAFAWADRVSLGALTQGVSSLDLSLEWGDA